MKKRITRGISFPHEQVLKRGKERADALGLTSFSEYVNHLIRRDIGMPNLFDAIHEEPLEPLQVESEPLLQVAEEQAPYNFEKDGARGKIS
ncbi:MAG: hypothetical protein ACPGGJ_03560 [Coraliomargarita sp.]